MDDFIDQVIPGNVRTERKINLVENWAADSENSANPPFGRSEGFVSDGLKALGQLNIVAQSYIGCGYYGTVTPEVIKRNVLESPAWYTSYTPYQAEISQGRLESLLNFQTMITDLTGLPIANASLLDEATAAAEAMAISYHAANQSLRSSKRNIFIVSDGCHPQTVAVLKSRAEALDIQIVVGDVLAEESGIVRRAKDAIFGVLVQYPDTYGSVFDFQQLSNTVHEMGATLSVATDLLALTRLKEPGQWGADIAFGSAQRFGVPLGYGGPHAAFFACSNQLQRKMPGRIVGVSKDRLGNRAFRLALQTREQHIRREKATSNICTAQALLANISAFYAIYHGPHGLRRIADEVSDKTAIVQRLVEQRGFSVYTKGVRSNGTVLSDTVAFQASYSTVEEVQQLALQRHINLRRIQDDVIALSLHEGVSIENLVSLLGCFGIPEESTRAAFSKEELEIGTEVPTELKRTTPYLTHETFNKYHSETEMLRYIHHLQSKDLSLTNSMIPLGSCTMKLNAGTEMVSLTDANFANIHPFAPANQVRGYQKLIANLGRNLATITGMHAVSLQPNSGAQGEFAGLRVIRKYHEENDGGRTQRNICLIPVSAHGTNPASAAMAGLKVVPVRCQGSTGNLDIEDLEAKCARHKDELAGIMITYPSTFGVFEPHIKQICDTVHGYGGQVYMDGANLNAQIGLCSPGEIGADVCHLNLHKTFCIPHGGGGPGVGPIGVKEHLAKYLPTHPFIDPHAEELTREDTNERLTSATAPVSAAPWGSASLLAISHAYTLLMGGSGLTHQTKVALLNANYMMSRLAGHYPIAYVNENGRCAHEFILDTRSFKETANVEAVDIAKRLQDYGFHAPTLSWPITNTLMIEPTESESKEELDRFCDALIQIREEIRDAEEGRVPREGNLLKNAPHPMQDLLQDGWERPYTREEAAYPLPWLRHKKFWPSIARVDDTYGDLNLFCTCPPMDSE